MKDLFQLVPFYEDFHALVYLETDSTAKLVMNEQAVKSVIEQMSIARVIQSKEYILSHVYKVGITTFELTNGYSVAVIRKDYLWDYFHSIGVIVVISTALPLIQSFLEKTFISKLS